VCRKPGSRLSGPRPKLRLTRIAPTHHHATLRRENIAPLSNFSNRSKTAREPPSIAIGCRRQSARFGDTPRAKRGLPTIQLESRHGQVWSRLPVPTPFRRCVQCRDPLGKCRRAPYRIAIRCPCDSEDGISSGTAGMLWFFEREQIEMG